MQSTPQGRRVEQQLLLQLLRGFSDVRPASSVGVIGVPVWDDTVRSDRVTAQPAPSVDSRQSAQELCAGGDQVVRTQQVRYDVLGCRVRRQTRLAGAEVPRRRD